MTATTSHAPEEPADHRLVTQGWDSFTEIVDGRWVDRRPRRPEVARALLAETAVLPRVAAYLPLEVPVPVVVEEEPLRVRHRLVPGLPADPLRLTAADGEQFGRFLRALHRTPPMVYAGTGILTAEQARTDLERFLDECTQRVLPLVDACLREAAAALLEGARRPTAVTLVHADLGPGHLLADGRGRLTGVIDWSDALVGDPARDLAWALNGCAAPFADAVATSYGASPEQTERALVWHRLGPWYEAHWGVSGGPDGLRDSGLAGIESRLSAPPAR